MIAYIFSYPIVKVLWSMC